MQDDQQSNHDAADDEENDASQHRGTASASGQYPHEQYPLHNPPATNAGMSTNFGMSQEEIENMITARVNQQMQARFELQGNADTRRKRKRKVSRSRATPHVERHVDASEESSEGGSDQESSYLNQSAHTARRILWQRGHQANVPSKVQQIIQAATVKSMSEAWKPLCEIGFAIIEDMTEVFAPKNRCTMEQRDYIHKCA